MPSSTLKLTVSALNLPTHTLRKTGLARRPPAQCRLTPRSPATRTSLTLRTLLALLLIRSLFQLPLKLIKVASNFTNLVSSAVFVAKTWTTEFFLLATELKQALTTGKSRTPGALPGANKGTLECAATRTNAAFPMSHPTLLIKEAPWAAAGCIDFGFLHSIANCLYSLVNYEAIYLLFSLSHEIQQRETRSRKMF